MDNSFFVGGGKSACDLNGVVDCFARSQAAPGYFFAKGGAVEQFRNQVGRAFMAAHLVDRENVGVVQGGEGARFLLEAPEAIGIP